MRVRLRLDNNLEQELKDSHRVTPNRVRGRFSDPTLVVVKVAKREEPETEAATFGLQLGVEAEPHLVLVRDLRKMIRGEWCARRCRRAVDRFHLHRVGLPAHCRVDRFRHRQGLLIRGRAMGRVLVLRSAVRAGSPVPARVGDRSQVVVPVIFSRGREATGQVRVEHLAQVKAPVKAPVKVREVDRAGETAALLRVRAQAFLSANPLALHVKEEGSLAEVARFRRRPYPRADRKGGVAQRKGSLRSAVAAMSRSWSQLS